MALLPLNLDYTDKDFSSLRVRLFNMIPAVFPDWTERDIANFGNILVELFAHVGDVLLFYQDNQAKQSRLSDATLRKSILDMAKMLNYTPEGNAAASVNVTVTLSSVPTADVRLVAGQVYETKEVGGRQSFQQLFDEVMPAGSDPPEISVIVENSEDQDEVFESTGLPSQSFTLTNIPFLDNSEVISATNGGFSRVDNFLSATSTDRVYTLVADANGRGVVRFGDGVGGELPVGTINTFYRTGGGSVGNVDANTITRIEGTITDVNGLRTPATSTNPLDASGGFDRESISSIKQKAPPSTKVTDRTVSLDDYEVGAQNVPGVTRSLMVTSDIIVGVPENRGFLYIVPDGGGFATDALKATVTNELTVVRPNTITFQFTVEDPEYLTVDVASTLFFTSGFNDTAKRNTVTSINTAVEEYFQITNDDGTPNELVKFGIKYGDDSTLPLSDLFCHVENVPGVRKIDAGQNGFLLNLVHGDVPLNFFQFPVLGTVIITDGDTGLVVSPI